MDIVFPYMKLMTVVMVVGLFLSCFVPPRFGRKEGAKPLPLFHGMADDTIINYPFRSLNRFGKALVLTFYISFGICMTLLFAAGVIEWYRGDLRLQ